MKFIIGIVTFSLVIFGIFYFYQDQAYKYLKAFFGGGSYRIYRDELNRNWTPVLKNGEVKFNSKTQVYADRYSIEFKPQQAPASLRLTTVNLVDLTEFITLKIAARASAMNSDLTIQLLDGDFQPVGMPVNLARIAPIYSDEWQLYRLPVTAFNVGVMEIGGIAVTSTASGVTYYLDSIEFQDF